MLIPTEHERRFLLLDVDPAVLDRPADHIQQGYFDTPPGREFRCRIVNGTEAFLTAKRGRGRSRQEPEVSTNVGTAEFMLREMPHRLEKNRRRLNGWEIDELFTPLNGIYLAEYEGSLEEVAALTQPPWVRTWVEVTNSLSNHHLAILATHLRVQADASINALPYVLPRTSVKIIALTGGPGSGKSTILTLLKERYGDLLHCVPEVASIVMEQVGARPPKKYDSVANLRFQEQLPMIQRSFERLSVAQAIQDEKAAVVLDRGLPDNAAYLGGMGRLCGLLGTSNQDILNTYDYVFQLAVPPEQVYRRIQHNNPSRTETYEEASALQERIGHAWSRHYRYWMVMNEDWGAKVDQTLMLIQNAANLPKRSR